jgi:hypothetical protein
MNRRHLLTLFLVVLCMGSVWAVVRQQQRLVVLRQQSAVPDGAGDTQPADAPAESQPQDQQSEPKSDGTSSELMRLRAEVTRLTARKRELAGVPAESEHLRAQAATQSTVGSGGTPLPPGYIPKSAAQRVGYRTPEDALQTFLWALQSRDLANLSQALTPAAAQELNADLARSGRSAESFFDGPQALPGMVIQSRNDLADGGVEMKVEITPGTPSTLKLQSVNGEWKLDLRFRLLPIESSRPGR